MTITSYYIDDNDTLFCYAGRLLVCTIQDVKSEERAEELINEIENQ